jgi:hypothetical protein
VITECSVEDDIKKKMLIMYLMCGAFFKADFEVMFQIINTF